MLKNNADTIKIFEQFLAKHKVKSLYREGIRGNPDIKHPKTIRQVSKAYPKPIDWILRPFKWGSYMRTKSNKRVDWNSLYNEWEKLCQ